MIKRTGVCGRLVMIHCEMMFHFHTLECVCLVFDLTPGANDAPPPEFWYFFCVALFVPLNAACEVAWVVVVVVVVSLSLPPLRGVSSLWSCALGGSVHLWGCRGC